MCTDDTRQVRTHYARLAPRYSRDANRHAASRYLVECQEWLCTAHRVLDIGCGDGQLVAALSARALAVGVDSSMAMLATGPPDLARLVALGEQLPFPDRAFDGACSINLLEHAAAPERIMAEMGRVLSPGGRALVITPAAECAPILEFAELVRLKLPEGPHRFLTREELASMAVAAGFNIVTVRRIVLLPVGGTRIRAGSCERPKAQCNQRDCFTSFASLGASPEW